jgi:N-acetyltransferase
MICYSDCNELISVRFESADRMVRLDGNHEGSLLQITQTALTKDFVVLEPLAERHYDGILASVRDPSIWKYMGFADLSDDRAVRTWFNAALEEPGKGIGAPFAVIDRNSGAVLGSTSLYEIHLRHQRCELGRSWLIPSVRRTGVNTRTKLLLLTHAFEAMEMQRVQMRASAGNRISRIAIESLGAACEGILRNYSVLPGGVRTDTALYSILREEWPRVKQALLSRLERPFVDSTAGGQS